MRDLNDSWDDSKNDPDLDVLYGDLGDITFVDATTCKEQMKGTGIHTHTQSLPINIVFLQCLNFFIILFFAESNTVPASESEEMKNGSETESEEDDDDSGGVADTNQEGFESNVSASDNVAKVDTVPTVLVAEESEESCEADELMDAESEMAIVSDKKTQESDSDEWSDYEISEIDEKSLRTGEMIDSESEESSVADNNTKNKENVEEEMVLDNNGEKEAEVETKKKKNMIDEESLKGVSVRQLTKLLKKLAIKNKQQHKSLE